ncbi:hypothetical protein ABPG72_018033 [Tetrahymena utriculariae]
MNYSFQPWDRLKNYNLLILFWVIIDLRMIKIIQESKEQQQQAKRQQNHKHFKKLIQIQTNNVEDIGLSYLGQGIRNLPKLQSSNINLQYNQISTIGIEFLFEELKKFLILTYLHLNINENQGKKNNSCLKNRIMYFFLQKTKIFFSLFRQPWKVQRVII